MKKFSPAQLAAQERFRQMVKSGAWPKRGRKKKKKRCNPSFIDALRATEPDDLGRQFIRRRSTGEVAINSQTGSGPWIVKDGQLVRRVWATDEPGDDWESVQRSNPRARRPLPEAWAAHKAKRKKQWAAYWGKKRRGNPRGEPLPDSGWREWMAEAYSLGLSDAKAGRPRRPKQAAVRGFGATYNQGYDHGLRRGNPTLMVLEGAAAANPIRNPRLRRRSYAKKLWKEQRRVGRIHSRVGRSYGAGSWDPKRRHNPTVPGAALKMYRRFHGTDPMSVIRAPDQPGAPKYVVALGRLKDVSYQVPGHSKKAGRRNIPYKHISGKGNLLCTDASGRNLYIVKTRASRMRVRSNGIHD